jgi:hypothetical protein
MAKITVVPCAVMKVVRSVITNVFNESAASIFRVKLYKAGSSETVVNIT